MYESHRLSQTSIYDVLDGSCGRTTTIYTHDNDNFYRYAFDYQPQSNYCSYKKFILTTVQLVEQSVIEFRRPIRRYALMSFQDVKDFGYIFDTLFKNELIYLDFVDMTNFVMQRIRVGQLNPDDKVVQELIDLYPELFI